MGAEKGGEHRNAPLSLFPKLSPTRPLACSPHSQTPATSDNIAYVILLPIGCLILVMYPFQPHKSMLSCVPNSNPDCSVAPGLDRVPYPSPTPTIYQVFACPLVLSYAIFCYMQLPPLQNIRKLISEILRINDCLLDNCVAEERVEVWGPLREGQFAEGSPQVFKGWGVSRSVLGRMS